jgi:succinyl-diaminopimelate desuccinylase
MFEKFLLENKEKYFRLLSEIVSKKSVLGNELLVGDVIIKFLDSLDIEYSVHFKNKSRPNIIAKVGSGSKSVGFFTHMDVVPVVESDWDTNPFEAVRKNGFIFGRGVSDDKAHLVSVLMILEYFKLNPVKGVIYGVFCSDEEAGGIFGLNYLIENNFLPKLDFSFVLDTSGEMKKVFVAERGSIKLKVVAKGIEWHSAYTHLGGDNAITRLSFFLSSLKDFSFSYVDHKFLVKPSVEPVFFNAGLANNVIPGSAEAILNIRFLPSQSVDVIIKELECFSKKFGLFEFEVLSFVMPAELKDYDEIVGFILEAGKLNDLIVEVSGINAGTDLKKLISNGFVAVAYGFARDGVAHTSNEYIVEADFWKFCKVLNDLVFVCFSN